MEKRSLPSGAGALPGPPLPLPTPLPDDGKLVPGTSPARAIHQLFLFPCLPGKSPQVIVVLTMIQENSKILEYTNALLVGFSEFFIYFFIFCFGLIFDSDFLFHIFKRSTLSLCFNPYQHLQTRKKGTIEMKLNGKRRTSNELSTFFTFLSYTFDTEYFHPAQKSEPLVDRLMTLCLSFQMEKAKKHSNYKRFILL
ncbi:hypothetical protein LEP1GSC108_3308 [Leptospira weilii str. UI 13098]|uniref:Uncharacterized protein n=1 Tax=Leptospira weilii str. UI 13098 TaxID=1088542 RepID=M6Q6S4_9LEPT|nr:hypothetical protein LEP1GSC108_3308 [Leptospira weilii str. UI 13098]